jgi:hypothetical protein
MFLVTICIELVMALKHTVENIDDGIVQQEIT